MQDGVGESRREKRGGASELVCIEDGKEVARERGKPGGEDEGGTADEGLWVGRGMGMGDGDDSKQGGKRWEVEKRQAKRRVMGG